MLRYRGDHKRRKDLTVYLIRHGKIRGNVEKRFIGSTDEPLCETGIAELKAFEYPDCDRVVSSPMLRCIQTAGIIFPDKTPEVYDELRECDFGIFEGKCHAELDGDPVYMKWIANNGMTAPPGGEDVDGFRERCVRGFLRAVRENGDCGTLAVIAHGGTIMSIMEQLAVPHKEFYEYITENGRGCKTVFDGEKLEVKGSI